MSNLPTPGRYTIDPTHSSIDFVVRHLMAAKVRGGFTSFSGAVTVGETIESSSVEVEIDVASIDTGVEDRDNHLRSADFFDVDSNPTARFISTAVNAKGGEDYTVTGDLTIAGVTKSVDLDMEFAGKVVDPWGNNRLVFSASTDINREDFGLTWNQALETGGVLVSKNAKIEIEVQVVQAGD
jgi:polyisoprenoid-binding protein YceI